MGTLVCFHAHPDDEATATAGTMAKAAAEGHRVVLVTATRGEHGEVADGFLRPGEALWERRVEELEKSAAVLGVARVELLGYEDSGMMGTPENEASGAFWRAKVDEAAERLAAILREERADVLTIYDDHGNYGHPDHIQVHRVGVRAAELAGTPNVFEATMNRDEIKRLMQMAAEFGMERPEEENPDIDFDSFGSAEADVTTCIDVTNFIEVKKDALRAHASQVHDTNFFLTMPDEAFALSFGREWFIHRGHPRRGGPFEDRVI